MNYEELCPVSQGVYERISTNAPKLIPDYMIEGVLEYVIYGAEPSDFLNAVMSNNLTESFARADAVNTLSMRGWAQLIWNYLPQDCHGSEAAVTKWVNAGGTEGQFTPVAETAP